MSYYKCFIWIYGNKFKFIYLKISSMGIYYELDILLEIIYFLC